MLQSDPWNLLVYIKQITNDGTDIEKGSTGVKKEGARKAGQLRKRGKERKRQRGAGRERKWTGGRQKRQ